MGYYTRHELTCTTIDGKYVNEEQHKVNLSEISNYAYCSLWDDTCKWYEHEAEMREYSKLHPTTLFILKGEGEESGDLWKEYYYNGKKQRVEAKIFFTPFNEKELK